jgi:hypothetical protein
VAGCCECGDEPSGSCATELENQYEQKYINVVNYITSLFFFVISPYG